VPGPLDALERIMEEAVEGTVLRLFRPKLQPVQLAKAAARQMEAQQVVGPSGLEVPNSYAISLHPQDFERFARYQMALQRELEQYLSKYARDRGWRPVSALTVSLTADASVSIGRPRVAARMIDTAMDAASAPQLDVPLEQTVRQPRVSPPVPPVSQDDTRAELVNERGERFKLAGPVITIGRALENDVVLSDARVSRFHAELRQENGRFVLCDLGSTNGTQVAGETVERRVLGNGETISLGGYELTYRET
jgi:hypothetical protein